MEDKHVLVRKTTVVRAHWSSNELMRDQCKEMLSALWSSGIKETRSLVDRTRHSNLPQRLLKQYHVETVFERHVADHFHKWKRTINKSWSIIMYFYCKWVKYINCVSLKCYNSHRGIIWSWTQFCSRTLPEIVRGFFGKNESNHTPDTWLKFSLINKQTGVWLLALLLVQPAATPHSDQNIFCPWNWLICDRECLV